LKEDLAISSGSACTTTSVEPSHVLLAIGRTIQQSHTAVRFGLGRFNKDNEVEYAINKVELAVQNLNQLIN
jgi:cysteine desulfurase